MVCVIKYFFSPKHFPGRDRSLPLSSKKCRHTLFNDPPRDSTANNFVISVYCRCLQIL